MSSITLKYKGRSVGTRRADLVLKTKDASSFVLELKVTATLTPDNLKQLEFYMHYLDINVGYLINFPHDSGFPDFPRRDEAGVCGGGDDSVFIQTLLLGSPGVLSDRSFRGKHDNASVQIVKVERRRNFVSRRSSHNVDNMFFSPTIGEDLSKMERQRSPANVQSAHRKFDHLFDKIKPLGPPLAFGVTLKGQLCKICFKQADSARSTNICSCSMRSRCLCSMRQATPPTS